MGCRMLIGRVDCHRVAMAFLRIRALPTPSKPLARFCVRVGFLPRWAWFRRWLAAALLVPLHPRDGGSGMNGYLNLGQVGPREVKRLQDWWTG